MKKPQTIGEARKTIDDFLIDTGCNKICQKCPLYGKHGCCEGCDYLVEGKGCTNKNLSCLTYSCTALNSHLLNQSDPEHENKLVAFVRLTEGLPREGYRGSSLRKSSEILSPEKSYE